MSEERELLKRAFESMKNRTLLTENERNLEKEISYYLLLSTPEPMQDEPADISAKSGPTIAAMLPNGVAVSNVYEAYEAGLKEGNLQYENPVATLDHSGRFVLLKMVGIPIGQPMKLYEHPAPRKEFVRLSDDEISELWSKAEDAHVFARDIEILSREKNK